MGKSLTRKQRWTLLAIIGVVLLLPLAIYLALNNSELRKLAQGSNEVGIRFSPAQATLSAGQTLDATVSMYKVATRTIAVSGTQSVLEVSDKFTINSAACQAPFDGVPFSKINGQQVTIICAISPGAAPVTLATTAIPFAKINLTVKSTAVAGTAPITYTSTRVTEAGVSGQAPDLSTAGDPPSFEIAAIGTEDVYLNFSPSQISLPPDSPLTLKVDPKGKSIAFARVVLTFDKSKVNLASEITQTGALSTVVEKTTMANANSSGQAVIVIAASPTDTQPSSPFDFATFSLKAVASGQATTNLDFLSADMQIVEGSGSVLTVGTDPLAISLNGGTLPTVPPIGDQTVFFEPSTGSLPPDASFKIMVNGGSQNIAFGRVVFTFDQSKVNLASEITTNPNLSTVVEKTTMANANSQGKATIVIAASPTDSQPSGAFEFANLVFSSVASGQDSTNVSFLTSDMQFVDGTGAALPLSAGSLSLGLNGGSVATPTLPSGNPCTDIASDACYEQWKAEFGGIYNTLYADLDESGQVDMVDYEVWRRAKFPIGI